MIFDSSVFTFRLTVFRDITISGFSSKFIYRKLKYGPYHKVALMELTIERKRIRVTAVLVALITLSLLVLPASAAINQIAQGGDVFIGEEGLDVTAAVGNFTQIAWFVSGANPWADAPNYIVAVGNPTTFYIAPADFVGRTGNWFVWDGGITLGVVAINVVDPNLDIKVWDQNANKDVTGKQIPEGNVENFRVETNVYSVVNRPSYAGEGFVNIKVKTADGATYTALETPANVMKSLTGQAITQSLWYWAVPAGNTTVGWDTAAKDDAGFPLYNTGIYTVSAELNLNKIKDNYKAPDGKDYTGKTVTSLKTIAISSDTVKIEASKDTVVRGNQFSVTVTGRTDEFYYVWVKGTGSMTGGMGDQPPLMTASQDNVANDPVAGPYNIGSYVYEGGEGKTIMQDVPAAPDNGVSYYAKIKTSSSGVRTIGFRTTQNTKDNIYTIRVENNFNGQYKSDEVKVEVEKGIVTIVAAGDQNYFLGQEVKFSGINSETGNVYLFIIGPDLPTNGGLMTSPQTAVNPFVAPPLFTIVEVFDDNTWAYNWNTKGITLNPGNYTIYAVEAPNDKNQLDNALFGNVSIILNAPFVTAQVSKTTVEQGEPLFIRGVAEGDPSQGVAIWVIGQNFVAYNTEGVNDDGTFEYEIDGGMTSGMPSGQYFAIVQHPTNNDELDVYPQAAEGYTYRYVVGPYPDPTKDNILFTLEGPGSLQGSDAANALTVALDNSTVDDTYTKIQFLVEGEVEAPVANFTANATSGSANLTVQFTDISTNEPTSWAWDFGDSANSTLQNPVHTYTNYGTYNVSLTVTNAAGEDTIVKNDYIQVIPMVGGDKGYYLIHCNVEGAKVYFDEDYKGDIINGTLLVKIYLTATPYHRYSVSKAGYVTVNEALPTYPAKDETKDIFVTLVDVTDGSWTRPPYPEVTRIQPGYPDSNWTRPPYPEVTRIQPGYPDSNWTRPPYPEVTRIQPGYPDSNWTRPAYLDWIWNRSSFHNIFKEMFDLQ
ncbi:MAG TPA: MEMAR_RS02690 family S-layer glycoprotein [Methanoregulaceae archaeon]|nr:MEMAR_RS02690 family S-layer glycoprotein [Methanoregulaceae archaeon]